MLHHRTSQQWEAREGLSPLLCTQTTGEPAAVTELAKPRALVSDPAPMGAFLPRRPTKISSHVLFSLCSGGFITLPCPFLLSSYFFVYGYTHTLVLVCPYAHPVYPL